MTKIEWVRNPDGSPGETWNPIRGCSKVSEGCRNCYAARIAARFSDGPVKVDAPTLPFTGFAFRGRSGPFWTGRVELVKSKLEEPLRWKKPQMVFVNSMSDLFHESLPDEAIDRVFAVMALCPKHTFIILTKRAERMGQYQKNGKTHWNVLLNAEEMIQAPLEENHRWPLANVWLGVSIEDQATADERIPLLLQTPAAKRLVSFEPALGPLSFRWAPWEPFKPAGQSSNEFDGLRRLDWVICGGDTGPGARPMHPDWARTVRDQCQTAGVAFFFKQWGEWAPASQVAANGPITHAMLEDGTLSMFDRESMMLANKEAMSWEGLRKAGRKPAGRLLDDCTWDQIPGRKL